MCEDSDPFQSTALSNVGKVEGRVVACDIELLNIFPLEFNHLRLKTQTTHIHINVHILMWEHKVRAVLHADCGLIIRGTPEFAKYWQPSTKCYGYGCHLCQNEVKDKITNSTSSGHKITAIRLALTYHIQCSAICLRFTLKNILTYLNGFRCEINAQN